MDQATKQKMENVIQQMLSSDATTQALGVADAYSLTCSNAASRVFFADNARLLERLVFFLKQTNNATNQSYAHSALYFIAETGATVQLKIAQALDVAALSAMEKRSDKRLRNMLMKNPSMEALLTAKQGKQHVITLLDATRTVNDSGVRYNAMLDTLCAIADGSLTVTGGISAAETQEVLLDCCLSSINQVHRDRVWHWVLDSLESIADHIRVAKQVGDDRTTALTRRRAVLWLAYAIQVDKVNRREIVVGGGVAALVAELEREICRTDSQTASQKLSSDATKRQIVLALVIVAAEIRGRTEIMLRGGLVPLVAYHNASIDSDSKLAVQAVQQFMVDDRSRDAIILAGGIWLVVVHLLDWSIDELNVQALKVGKQHLFPESSMQCAGDNKGIIERRSTIKRVLQSMTGMIPSLLQLSDPSSLLALAIMSEDPTNCKTIVEASGINTLTELVRGSSSDVKAVAIRVLANVAYKNDENSILICNAGLVNMLIQLFINGNDDVVEAAATALRNLCNNDVNRTKIGTSGIIPCVVNVVQTATSFRLREAAAGMLGNLARQNHDLNQQSIALCGGIPALVAFAQAAKTARQRQTVTMALWVLVKENGDCREQFLADDGIEALEQVEQLHEPQSEAWAKRVLATIRPVVQSRR